VIDAFKKAFPSKDDFGAYTMPAYDSAKILIAAIGRAIKANNGNKPSREAVRAEVAKTKDFKGVLGTYSFDQRGDTTQKIISIYEAKAARPTGPGSSSSTSPENSVRRPPLESQGGGSTRPLRIRGQGKQFWSER
jgi:ABC-type branched-subunit amino acid transport system substrate-binding protein